MIILLNLLISEIQIIGLHTYIYTSSYFLSSLYNPHGINQMTLIMPFWLIYLLHFFWINPDHIPGSGDGQIHAWNISDEPNKVLTPLSVPKMKRSRHHLISQNLLAAIGPGFKKYYTLMCWTLTVGLLYVQPPQSHMMSWRCWIFWAAGSSKVGVIWTNCIYLCTGCFFG